MKGYAWVEEYVPGSVLDGEDVAGHNGGIGGDEAKESDAVRGANGHGVNGVVGSIANAEEGQVGDSNGAAADPIAID
jgi:hypothetical protein